MTRAALRSLLLDTLRLWDAPGTATWQGAELHLLTTAGQSATLWPATPVQHPARWFLREASGRTRPALSVTGLLTALRAALDIPPTRLRLRVAPEPSPKLSPEPSPEPAPEPGDVATPVPRVPAPPGAGRIPVLVVTGALGSGKTTLIAHMLQDPGYGRTAVIVNEFGAVGLDHALVSTGTDPVVQLATGCLCCAIRTDLLDTLATLHARREAGQLAFDRVVVETSGLADPAPILHGLLTDPAAAAAYAPCGLLTLVDPIHAPDSLLTLAEARHQLALADRILFTKADQARPSPALQATVAAFNPGATLHAAAHGRVDPEWLFAPGTLPRLPPASRFATAAHTPGIGHLVLTPAAPVPGAALALFLQALAEHAGPRLLRAKGLLLLAEVPGRPALLHGIRHVFEPLQWLEAWPPGTDSSFLVLIAQDLPPRWPALLLSAITTEVDAEAAARAAG